MVPSVGEQSRKDSPPVPSREHCKGERFGSSPDAQSARQPMGFKSVVTQVCCAGEWEKWKTFGKVGETPVITGGDAALFIEKMVFVCLKNLWYAFILLTQIRF